MFEGFQTNFFQEWVLLVHNYVRNVDAGLTLFPELLFELEKAVFDLLLNCVGQSDVPTHEFWVVWVISL